MGERSREAWRHGRMGAWRLGIWDLKFVWNLEFGFWDFGWDF
jgi:hypothetical protein